MELEDDEKEDLFEQLEQQNKALDQVSNYLQCWERFYLVKL